MNLIEYLLRLKTIKWLFYELQPIQLILLQTQFLHCIDQFNGDGGESQFVDGFHVEKIIRQSHPEEHKILTTTKVDFVDVGTEDIAGEFSKMFQASVFK